MFQAYIYIYICMFMRIFYMVYGRKIRALQHIICGISLLWISIVLILNSMVIV